MVKKNGFRIVCFLFGALSWSAQATPSSNLWAPSTASCQAYAVPHLTYDSYVRKGPGPSSDKTSAYANTYGLTVGFLPLENVQGEIGWDMILPGEEPHFINGKLCTPESTLFAGAPAVSFGVYSVGFKENVSDYNISYLMLQKSLHRLGSIALGAYHGGNKRLFTNSDGKVVRDGFMAALVSRDWEVGYSGLKKLNFLIDMQTGKNAFGAWAIGSNIYFADHVSLLLGPVFFFDRKAQPNGSDMLWAIELDVDLPL